MRCSDAGTPPRTDAGFVAPRADVYCDRAPGRAQPCTRSCDDGLTCFAEAHASTSIPDGAGGTLTLDVLAFPGGLCTTACGGDADCGACASCIPFVRAGNVDVRGLVPAGGVCRERCDPLRSACRPGYLCDRVHRVCLEACTSDDQCRFSLGEPGPDGSRALAYDATSSIGCRSGRCVEIATCTVPGDCDSRVCRDGLCVDASCSDAVLNGGEIGIDCGGTSPCRRCPEYGRCASDSDCASGLACVLARCGLGDCEVVATDAFGYTACVTDIGRHPGLCPTALSATTPIGGAPIVLPLGFVLDFYGTTFDRVYAHPSGALAFDPAALLGANECLPATSPGPIIAALWDEASPGGMLDHGAFGPWGSYAFGARWELGAPGSFAFSVALRRDTNDIDVCHVYVERGATDPTVGIADADAITTGESLSPLGCPMPALRDGLVVHFLHP
jgi:hypothetical protein